MHGYHKQPFILFLHTICFTICFFSQGNSHTTFCTTMLSLICYMQIKYSFCTAKSSTNVLLQCCEKLQTWSVIFTLFQVCYNLCCISVSQGYHVSHQKSCSQCVESGRWGQTERGGANNRRMLQFLEIYWGKDFIYNILMW